MAILETAGGGIKLPVNIMQDCEGIVQVFDEKSSPLSISRFRQFDLDVFFFIQIEVDAHLDSNWMTIFTFYRYFRAMSV